MQFKGSAGLILPGGGALAAYQVGVLKAIAELVDSEALPFDSISGVSAGAINAAALAQDAGNFIDAVAHLERLWTELSTTDVFTLDYGLMRGFMAKTNKPQSFLNIAPLTELLQRELGDDKLVKIQLKNGHLKGLAVTASNYSTGEATTFFESSIESLYWHDRRRDSVRTCIGVPHLLASAALPLLFPPQRIGNEYFVDGSLRMNEPLRPVIKMGADRILVIGVRNETLPLGDEGEYHPGVAEIAGFTLDSLFAENLNTDIARMKQINNILNHTNWKQGRENNLKQIKVMVIRPSQDLRVIAARFAVKLPRGIRLFLRTIGGWGHEWRLPSFLLFEGVFARELINLGYYDGLKQQPKMNAFFS